MIEQDTDRYQYFWRTEDGTEIDVDTMSVQYLRNIVRRFSREHHKVKGDPLINEPGVRFLGIPASEGNPTIHSDSYSNTNGTASTASNNSTISFENNWVSFNKTPEKRDYVIENSQVYPISVEENRPYPF